MPSLFFAVAHWRGLAGNDPEAAYGLAKPVKWSVIKRVGGLAAFGGCV